MTRQAFLIFSGYNQRAVIAFCREATRLNVPFFIVAKSEEDTIFLTAYRDRVLAIRQEKGLSIPEVDACIQQVREVAKYDSLVILPSSEFLNRFFLDHRLYYESLGCRLPLVHKSLYETISDKWSFGQLCLQYGLRVPRTFSGTGERPLLPFVAKPIHYFATDGSKTLAPYLIYTEEDWKAFTQKENKEWFYFQEFIEGRSFYLLFYLSQRGSCLYSQENLVQQAEGKSIILAKSAHLHEEAIASQYKDMLENEGFSGLIMIELRQKAGEYIMIEANPRLWGPSQLFIDAGVPLFEYFIRDQGFEIKNAMPFLPKEVYYYWNGGLIEDGRQQKQVVFHGFDAELFQLGRPNG
jgi:hypothetical protein